MSVMAFSSFLVIAFFNLLVLGRSESQFPCFFIFGDSMVDNGNNNNLATEAKVNYVPYGVDFPQGPTGRFTNGRTIADFLAELLGFDIYIPPFATAKGRDIIKGVNYGSGAAGILNETGLNLGDGISLARQLRNHKHTISRLAKLLRNDTRSAKQHLSKCLYYFVMGSNDYINNYFMPEYYKTSTMYTTEQYADLLVQHYSNHLRTVYKYGARKIAVSPLGPIGCIPAELARASNQSSCVESINDAIELFNNKLKVLVRDLNCKFSDAKFIYLTALDPTLSDLLSLGIKFIGKPCCRVSSVGQCIPGEAPCLVRALYAFYDNFHPTEIVYKFMATASYVKIHTLI